MVSNMAVLEDDSNSKAPILRPGDISPDVMRKFEHACLNYFDHKEVVAEKQVRKILSSFKDSRISDWIANERDRLLTLSFAEFMAEIREGYLDRDWEDSTRRELQAMFQNNSSFRDFAVRVQGKNSLLLGTDSHLSDDKLRHRIEAGINDRLSKRCKAEKVNKVIDFKEWLAEVKRVDDGLQDDRREWEAMARNTREASRKNNVFAEPSRRYNTQPQPPSNNATIRILLPKLTDSERTLLSSNEGCFKCRTFFADHRSANCKSDFPNPVGYKTLTQVDVDRARKPTNKKVAAVFPALENTDENVFPSIHPVAAVVGSSSQPYAYQAANASSVLDTEGDSGSEDEVRPSQHMLWHCSTFSSDYAFPVPISALIDNGSHLVLIHPEYVQKLALPRHKLARPISVELAMHGQQKRGVFELLDYVSLTLFDSTSFWTAKPIRAIVCDGLCAPVILGLPFLERNNIVIDHRLRTATQNDTGFDLLNPIRPIPQPPLLSPRQKRERILYFRRSLINQLKHVLSQRQQRLSSHNDATFSLHVLAAIRTRIESLTAQTKLKELGKSLIEEFKPVFSPIPHIDNLPTDVYCRIKLKDATKTITTRSYSTPRKFRDAWQILIGQHLEAGRIRPSSSPHASPSFIVPKADLTVLPRWVNDYRELNSNTVIDSHPLPRVDDILHDCARGKIWSKMDMTNSFFQTRMHPDDIPLTAVTTPFGLYEWMVMPMGLRNSPPIHQRRMTAALREHIGKICHIYLDDIIIWSNTIEDHTKHIRMVLTSLQNASLYCNPKKCEFFLLEVDFLGHRISQRGVEAQNSKVDKILNWPVPTSATEVRAFLGIVRYISTYLPKLAEHTTLLTPLTTKLAKTSFPPWLPEHQRAFESIKALVISRECLTVIDHNSPGNNKIFVTCDASDWRTGATLSFGPTWETARPVAFDSMQLKGAEKNYPVHEKELLAIIRALKKWRSDLIGSEFFVYTDHRTLENFNTQRDLSRRQLRWQEFLSQYDFTIVYIPGEDNTVADALSRVPPDAFPDEKLSETEWSRNSINAILSISTDENILKSIKEGYTVDPFCKKLITNGTSVHGVTERNGLWYIGDRLLIPHFADLRENLFRLAHDTTGHFGSEKSYASLRDHYYWPNMRRDLELGYIPSCPECQRNKSRTTKPPGPLHPLPIPDSRGDSVALDFIGPLPIDEGHDCILTITDRLNSDIRIIPTSTKLTAAELASLFFNEWYCENGLPLEIISDRDKLFTSKFWTALHALTGVKLKLSTAFHPQTDGASERTNKTVIQALRYHVRRNQKGWVRALPKIRFDIMNSVNSSTGFTPFQLRMGRSPRVIPPLVPSALPSPSAEQISARRVIDQLLTDVQDAKDNMIRAKTLQAFFANHNRSPDDIFTVNDQVMLATLHRRQEYKHKDEKRAAKFFPRFDGPYKITHAYPETSTYTLDMPNSEVFPTFHASELKRFRPNDPSLYPSREHARPGPVLTADGLEEYFVNEIIDSRRRGRGHQYLVRWSGYGPEHDLWLPGTELENCAALDRWLAGRVKGPSQR
jgi:hypothetical protein